MSRSRAPLPASTPPGGGGKRRRRRSAPLAAGLVVGLVAAGMGGGAAFAAPGDRAEAEGLFLSGGALDAVAALDGAYTAFPPGAPLSAPIDLTALGAVQVGAGVQLFGGSDVLTLGAVGQYARTDVTGAFASSGLIGADGAIAVGTGAPGENTTLNLAPVLDAAGVGALVSDLSLELGAVSASALATRGATVTPVGDYQIASGEVALTAPVLAAVLTDLDTALAGASTAINGLAADGGPIDATVDGLLDGVDVILEDLLLGVVDLEDPAVTAALTVDLGSALDTVAADTFVSGPVSVTLSTGEVVVDLDELYALNDAAPNTPLLSDLGVNPTVTEALSDILTVQLPAALGDAIDDVLNSTALDVTVAAGVSLELPLLPVEDAGDLAITIDGTLGGILGAPGAPAPVVSVDGTELLGLELGELLTPVTAYVVGTVLPAVGGVVEGAFDLDDLEGTLTGALTGTVTALQPALAAVNTVVGITVNVQEAGDFRDPRGLDAGAFTQRAATVSLLGGAIAIDLASATVRAVPLAAPADLAITPARGPVTGGTDVTITGSNLADVTGIVFGTVPVEAFTVNVDGSISTTAPAQAAPGSVPVAVTNIDGTTSTLAFEYFPVTTVGDITPDSGSTTGGDEITITGACLIGTTAVLFDGVAGTGLTVVGDTELTVITPEGTAGLVDVEIVDPTDCGGLIVDDGFTYVVPGAPILTGIAPERGPETGGTVVTITGEDLLDTTGVTFDGVPATDVTVVSDTEIEATTPPGTPAVVDVVVTNGAGASAGFDFEYFDVAQIDAITPDAGPETGGDEVVITGDCFTGATGVLFGGTPAADFTVVDDTVVTAVTPAGVGTVDVTVIGAGDCGPVVAEDAYEYFAAPTVTDLDPAAGLETGGTPVTITGAGFDGTTGVLFGTTPGTGVVVVSDTEIEVFSPAGTPGVVTVTVQHPGGDVAAGDFEYLNVPSVTAVDPTVGPEDGGTVVTITGEGFTDATGVTFGGLPGTEVDVVSDTEIVVTTPAQAPATVAVVVEHPLQDAAAGDFTYVAGTEISSVTPASGPEDGGTTVTIVGACFTDASAVQFGGVDAIGFTVVGDTEITAVVPAGTGTVDVTVVGAAACGTDTVPGGFVYIPAPVITDLAPTEGPESGGTVVTITGDGFTGTTGVTFDGVPGTDLVVIGDTGLQITTPAGVPGSATVTVLHPGGDVDAGGFEYLNEPSVTGIDPATGPDDGGTVVTITGEGFTDATGVTFGGLPGTAVDVVSDTEIVVTTPAQAPATVAVVVEHPLQDADAGDFTYVEGTEVTAVGPGVGPEEGGNTVTITGVCFTGASAVQFGGVDAADFIVVSDTEITAVVPAGVGVVDVTVVGSEICGTDVVTDAYEYVPAPVLDDVTPTEGPETGGTVVTITGEGLTETTGVLFGDAPGTDLVVVGDTEITVTTPAGTPGTVSITVQHPGGDVDAGDFVFLDVPGISGLAPAQGPEDGGTVVTITGEGFDGATGVTFDGSAGTAFTVVSDTEITVTTPPHAPATVAAVVLHPNGDSPAFAFRYLAGTEVEAVTPPGGPEEGGNTVIITGTCFTGATDVLFGGVPATGFTVLSDTRISAVAPAGAGYVDVTVIGAPECGTDTVTGAYEFTDDPVIGTIAPANGPATGGTVVTITGSNFADVTSVTFDGVPGTGLTVTSATELTVTTPAGTPGDADVVVTSPAGSSDAGAFRYDTVAAPAAGANGGRANGGLLPATGSDATGFGPLAALGLMLLIGGAVVTVRKRRTA